MQVSQIAQLDSHAVLGGSKPEAFFIAQSAEFFTTLSDTLYKDKKQAVVREVTCNAHDAHIMGECLSTPIEITLTDTELTIKDFGPGIHHDRMHGVYCGYGVTTKVADENQTGGFGLGCKAPFAYSDHFTVVSCHEGMRSVYAISRGGVESNGLPSMRRMVHVPTEETGITVSVPLKSTRDREEFARLVHHVVKTGGINATLNGHPIATIDYSCENDLGFVLVEKNEGFGAAPVYVKLGAVVYPVSTENPEINTLLKEFEHRSRSIVILAKSREVGITPARESLSYSTSTIEFITTRLRKILRSLRGHMPQVLKRCAEKLVQNWKPNTFNLKGYFRPTTGERLSTISNLDQVAEEIFFEEYEAHERNHHYGRKYPFFMAAGDTRKAVLRAAARRYPQYRKFFHREMALPTYEEQRRQNSPFRSLQLLPETGHHFFRVASHLGILGDCARYAGRSQRSNLIHVAPIRKSARMFTRPPIVIFTRSRQQAAEYLTVKGTDPNSCVFVVVRNMKTDQINQIRQEFKKRKFDLVELDFEKPQPKPKPAPKAKVEKTPLSELRFRTVLDVSGYYGRMRLNNALDMIPAGKTFVDCGALSDGYFRSSMTEILRHFDLIERAYPGTVLSCCAADKKALIELGAKNILEVIDEEFLSLDLTPDLNFAYFCGRREVFRESGATNFLNTLAFSDLRYGKFIAGKDMKVSEAERRAHMLGEILNKFGYDYLVGDATKKYYELNKKHRGINVDSSWLKPITNLTGVSHYTGRIEWSEDILEVLKTLKRLHSKKQSLKLVKEAA